MATRPINQILADNLALFMKERGFTSQPALAEKSGVAQRTIGNYLKPTLRQDSKSGKPPSAKLTELEKIAGALQVEVWELLRDIPPGERAFYAQIEEAYRKLAGSLRQERRVKIVPVPDERRSQPHDYGDVTPDDEP